MKCLEKLEQRTPSSSLDQSPKKKVDESKEYQKHVFRVKCFRAEAVVLNIHFFVSEMDFSFDSGTGIVRRRACMDLLPESKGSVTPVAPGG